MGEGRIWNLAKSNTAVLTVAMSLFLQNPLGLVWSLNDEGLALLRFRQNVVKDPYGALSSWNDDGGDIDHCSWFGVQCSAGNVAILNLSDLHLGGTLAPELGKLTKLKSIVLRNNSFSGTIPEEIGELKELEVLDLGHNNFTGFFPSCFVRNPSLKTLLLDNNRFLSDSSPKHHESEMFTWNIVRTEDTTHGRHLQSQKKKSPSRHEQYVASSIALPPASPSRSPSHPPNSSQSEPPSPTPSPPSPARAQPPNSSQSEPPSPTPSPPSPAGAQPPNSSQSEPPSPTPSPPSPAPAQPPQNPSPNLPPASTPNQVNLTTSRHNMVIVLAGSVGGASLIAVAAIGFMLFRSSKVVVVKPWVTGLSGQLQKAFVTGVPKLRRSELQSACEDFSNIIGGFSDSIVYKGTLSSGVEIAVISTSAKSKREWLKNLETQFRKTIETLSKVNHKNFVSLIGFCKEDEPFTRMMVFEYAPNGTLHEHLHVQGADHLDWSKRLRIAMGMAYCLDHMHQLTPPVVHQNLQSSSVYLTEDYAAKISDFTFWDNLTTTKTKPSTTTTELLEKNTESNVYSFGVILFEIVTGRIPHGGFIEAWEKLSKEMVDPALKSYKEDEVEKLVKLIKKCVDPDPQERPPMRDVVGMLRDMTALGPEGAIPKLSPLWWAELEILSTEES